MTTGTRTPALSKASLTRSRMAREAVTCWSGAALALTRIVTASPETDSTPAKDGGPNRIES
jgi:hypothetical protein